MRTWTAGRRGPSSTVVTGRRGRPKQGGRPVAYSSVLIATSANNLGQLRMSMPINRKKLILQTQNVENVEQIHRVLDEAFSLLNNCLFAKISYFF